MRTVLAGLLAATILSSTATAQSMAPFGAPSEPLSAHEKAEIHAEVTKAKRARAAAAERARKQQEAALAAKAAKEQAPETVVSAPVPQPAIESEAPPAMATDGNVNMPPVGAVAPATSPTSMVPTAAMPPVGVVPPSAPASVDAAPAMPPVAPGH